ncbi:SusC/RagA family TonB-linked outer membrane protein [Parapedobacter deserti]|uniref:SusC/RagA family TonB-linked outer membrane protein n=1 Tax=Parapedobacter deserti TaxID=1912957 RepID=A0ABV7JJU6_9SPHI
MRIFYVKCCMVIMALFGTATIIHAQQTVSGVVTDANGPLPGVSVSVQGTTRGTQTDTDGRYSIQASQGETLRFSIIGYQMQEVKVGASNTVNVQLKEDASELGEVVVTAMGIKREQRKLGYAVSTVSGAEITQAAPTNFASALYGKATGVSINTNAGGGNSAVAIDIRGNMNSISFQRQPLLVVDGVITRNGEANNDGYWADQRIRGNGILDINPENIESINILKGAAASALYGSDAAAGVIVVTTKSGRGSDGFGVEFSATYGIEQVGVLPDYQFDFGVGYERSIAQANFGTNDAGFIERVVQNGRIWLGDPTNSNTVSVPAPSHLSNGDIVRHPHFGGWAQFGPRFDGKETLYWDGQLRPYVAHRDNYQQFYRNGHNGIYNIAIFNSAVNGNYRFSYTRNDYQSVMESGPQGKNTFNLNSSYIVTPKISVDLVANYVNEQITNRPHMIDRLTNNYTGFLSPAQDIRWFMDRYRTSRGFKYVTSANRQNDPEEAFVLPTAGTDYMDYFWHQRENQLIERNNRLMGAATVTYNILESLSIRGRLGTDFTNQSREHKQSNEVPLHVGTSGGYSTGSDRLQFTYGDLLLSYNTQLSDRIGLSAQAGYQAREESYVFTNQTTRGGLSTVNWFSLSASNQISGGTSTRQTLVKDGLFAILGFDINNYLFVEGSLRQERASTLAPGNNVFYFPSVSSAFELSNAFTLPSFVDYSKLRASYGVVGNPPVPYATNVVYNANSASGTPTLNPQTEYGNNELRNEIKHEFEIGWETQLVGNRIGFDVTYYNNNIVDMILPLDVAYSTGAQRIMQNVGNMRNYGLELGLSGTPIRNNAFSWDSRINFGFNRNRVTALQDGMSEINHFDVDGGSIYVRSRVGHAAGDIFTYTLSQHQNGELLVGENGHYVPNFSQMVHAGNIQPKVVGGFLNSFSYKGIMLNTVIDFRFGGQVFSPAIHYGRSAGMFTETLPGRDEQTGGIPYYRNADGNFVQVPAGTSVGPNGEAIFNDGIILGGVTANGEPNTRIIEAGAYYRLSHGWGAFPGQGVTGTYERAIFDNDFIRMREIALTYTLPSGIADRLKASRVAISAYGRNLFFLHKTIPHLDPEATIGTDWLTRANIGNAGIVPRSFGLTLRAAF